MTSTDLRKLLECSLCQSMYKDPVMLPCGHNFCRTCIDQSLDTQQKGDYSCPHPQCRKRFRDRPALQRNIDLCNIISKVPSTQPGQKSKVFCTQCLVLPVRAVKSCVLCEASLCKEHLRVHSTAPEHVLCDPSSFLKSWRCSVHNQILDYYCTKDATCVCKLCLMDLHAGHLTESLDEASKKKKAELSNILLEVKKQREETEERIQSLEERKRVPQETADAETKRIKDFFTDLETTIQNTITRMSDQVLQPYDGVIQLLKEKKEELSRKIHHIEKLCNMTNPLTVLQESERGDLCNAKDKEIYDQHLQTIGDLNLPGMSHALLTGLSDIIARLEEIIPKPADIFLHKHAAQPPGKVSISEDRKKATYSCGFDNKHSGQGIITSYLPFSSGRYYWGVEVEGSNDWSVGVSRSDTEEKWCLCRNGEKYSVMHDDETVQLSGTISIDTVRIYLDLQAGQISFYALCDSNFSHLHTFTITLPSRCCLGSFQAVFSLNDGCIKIPKGNGQTRKLY